MVSASDKKSILIAGGVIFALLFLIALVPRGHDSGAGAGDVDSYRRDCVSGVLSSGNVPPFCSDLATIKKKYNVDPLFLLSDQRGRMMQTAQYVARGDLLTEHDLKACVGRGECVDIPLPDNEKNKIIFQQLVDGGALTPELCNTMDVCKALVQAKLVHTE